MRVLGPDCRQTRLIDVVDNDALRRNSGNFDLTFEILRPRMRLDRSAFRSRKLWEDILLWAMNDSKRVIEYGQRETILCRHVSRIAEQIPGNGLACSHFTFQT